MLQLPVPIPQFHRPILAPAFGGGQCLGVIRGFELTEVIDVPAEAVHEIKPKVTHSPAHPPVAK